MNKWINKTFSYMYTMAIIIMIIIIVIETPAVDGEGARVN